MKSNLKERSEALSDLTVVAARDAVKEIKWAQQLYIRDAESYGADSTIEAIKVMDSEDVSVIADVFEEISNEIEEIKKLFHQARKL